MSVRAEIKPAIERLVAKLRARRYAVDVALLRALRDFGVECHGLGVSAAFTTPTIAAPPPVPPPPPDATERSTVPAPSEAAADDITGRYSIQHPLRDDRDDHVKGQKS